MSKDPSEFDDWYEGDAFGDDFQDDFLDNARDLSRDSASGPPTPSNPPSRPAAPPSTLKGPAPNRPAPTGQPNRPPSPPNRGAPGQPPNRPAAPQASPAAKRPGSGVSGRQSPPKSASKPGGKSPARASSGGRSPAKKSPGGKSPAKSRPGSSPSRKKSSSPARKGSSPSRPGARRSPSRPSTPTRKKKSGSNNSAMRSLPAVQGIKVKSRATVRPEGDPKGPPEPDWVKRISKDIPPYADEMLAFLLVAIGLLSFFTLLSPSSGALGTAWSYALRQAFGVGSFAISGVIMVGGALLLMPKLGISARVNWWRVIFGELFFVFVLAYIHASIRSRVGGDIGVVEAFASATEGRGGGLVGWAVQDVLYMILGDFVTGVVLLGLIAVTAALMIGIRRRHLLELLTGIEARSTGYVERVNERAVLAAAAAAAAQAAAPAQSNPRPVSIRRTTPAQAPVVTAGRPMPGLPTAQRPTSTATPTPALASADPSAPAGSSAPEEPAAPVVEVPAIVGRPSIVTGETGYVALGMRRAETKPMRIGASSYSDEEIEEEEEELVVESRFTVKELKDKKKIGRRSEKLPSLDLLDHVDFERPNEYEINLSAALIEKTANDFGMQVEVVDVKSGPTVTQYAVAPYKEIEKNGKKVVQRVRVTRVANLGDDLALALSAPSVRVQAPVPGTNYIGFEVPNKRPGIVSLRPIIESEQFYKIKSPLGIALGREVDGAPFATDLSSMPHLLIGGSTGSGKSVCLSSITTCLITNNTPSELRLILLDPKMVEMVRFNGLPHLLGRVEVQLDRIIGVLRWVTREMDKRYKLMEAAQARNIDIYNKGRKKAHRLPRIVVLIDELAELMNEYPDETEHLVTRLAQMARATGIHLVVATQRPSTDVLTGLIKANFPARIAFAVPSGVDSRVIIDAVGAEDLIGRGDMLFQGPEAMAPVRLQGCFVGDAEMEKVVQFWQDTYDPDEDDDDETEDAPWERALTRAAVLEETDEMIEEAIRVCQREGEASASQLQRRLNVGYPRAGRIIDVLFDMKVVGEDPGGGRPREVLIDPDIDATNYIVTWRNENS